MTDQTDRYDNIALGYLRWWAPVLAPTARRLLDLVDDVGRTAHRVVDIGTGTGTLALAAVSRWPEAQVHGIDGSSEMAAVASAEADRTLDQAARRRLRFATALADQLPFDDGTIDLAVSSFVFQLVPNRGAALREARRVLRPGGTVAYVTWLAGGRSFVPDVEFDAALEDVGIGAREFDCRNGDIPSPVAALRQLRRAGFRDVAVRDAVLEYQFDPQSYLGFVSEFDEEDLFSELHADLRSRLESRMRARFSRLSADDFVLRLPVVFVLGRRP